MNISININQLNDLHNIIDNFIPDKKDTFLHSKDYEDFHETIDLFINDFITNNIILYPNKHFDEYLYDYIYDVTLNLFNNIMVDLDDNIEDIIENIIYSYHSKNLTCRSFKKSFIIDMPNVKKIKQQIKDFENMEQPAQKTEAWYKFRWNGLTASSLWKSLDSQSSKNSIIYQKCKPLDLKKTKGCNINSPFHNGHKYEPLSIIIYEDWFKTTVAEVGAIKHTTHPFLRASPDGINIDPQNPRFGRALEIKNPVNRELTGIPKKDYWIQMQLQMEVWDLEECDFLETTFKEYENEEEFLNDGNLFNKTKDDKLKGIIVRFFDGNEPVYKYPPLNLNQKDFDNWYDKIMDEDNNLSWIQNIYWYMDNYSLVLVPRNKIWFKTVLPELQNVWNTILKERVTGYEHRKPNKRPRKKKETENSIVLNKKKNNIKTTLNLPDSTIVKTGTIIIKVRTESFENSPENN